MVGGDGVEPPEVSQQIYSLPRYHLRSILPYGTPHETRTHNNLIRSQMLYPLELKAHIVYQKGLEPSTPGLKVRCASNCTTGT